MSTPDNRSVNFFSLFRRGQHYAKTWPMEKRLAPVFALSLPMQGLWWLGKRSVTPLPPSILNWFYEVRGKLQEAGQALAPVEGKPDYQALADTLKRAFKQLDKTFLDDL